MSTFSITLPDFNGEIEVGLAVGTDQSLPEDMKLPIIITPSLNDAAGYAGAWAYAKFAKSSVPVREFLTSAAIGVVVTGLARKVGPIPDGDWKELGTLPRDAPPAPPADTYTVQMITKALTVGIATKAMFFLTNHHTGGKTATGYPKKVLTQLFPDVPYR